MRQTNRHLFLFIMLLSSLSIWAQNTDYDLIRSGSKDYRQKYYRDAETNYQKAANKRGTLEAYYNLGNAMLRQGQDSVALVNFMKADSLGSVNNKKVAAVRHNIGNDYFGQAASWLEKDNKEMALNFFTKAVSAYKGALRKNPNDEETRHNLAKAQYWVKKLQDEQQQQQNQDKKNQNKNQDQNQQKQDKQNQDQKNKDDQNKDQQDKDKKDQQDQDKKDQDQDKDKKDKHKDQQNKDQNQQGQDPKNQQGQQPEQGQQRPGQPRQGEIDQETAKKLLDAAQQDEKRIQRRLKEQNKDPRNGYGQRKRKDW